MNYLYAVQWIDHGGVYHEPNWQDKVPTALSQMGFDPNAILIDIGGLLLEDEGGRTYAGYIETNSKLPKWSGLVKPSDRWVEDISLWFYTFQPPKDTIASRWAIEEFEEIFYGLDGEV